MREYKSCVCCSGSLVSSPLSSPSVDVTQCANCGGVHVESPSRIAALDIVNFNMWHTDTSDQDQTYFDITWPDNRVHGWFNPNSRMVTQFG